MDQQNSKKANLKYSKIKNHNLSHIVKKWQAFVEQKKDHSQIPKNIQNYLECPISSPNFSFTPKSKHLLSNPQGLTIKERQAARYKLGKQNKKKTLQIQDFDDSDIRNSAHSLEMIKNKSNIPQANLKTMTPEKRSIHKLPETNFSLKDKRHKSVPNQKNLSQTLSNNEYIKKILKKFQKHTSEVKEQNCFTLVKSNDHADFKKYHQAQYIKLFNSKTTFSANKYNNSLQNKIKTRMCSNIKDSVEQFQRKNPKRSIQISPWLTQEEQS